MHRNGPNSISFRLKQDAEFGFTNAGCIRQHGVEYRLELAGRRTNDPEPLARCGLLLQRLAQIIGAWAQFVEQPRVLDGDHGLGGEILQQLDLLVGEGAHLLAVDGDGADQFVFLEHWYGENGASTSLLDQANRPRLAFDVALLHPEVGNVLQLLCRDHAAEKIAGAEMDYWFAPPQVSVCGRCAMRCADAEVIPLAQPEIAKFGVADSYSIF